MSDDVYILIDGKEYHLTRSGEGFSFQREVLSQLDGIKKELSSMREELSSMREELSSIKAEQKAQREEIHSMGTAIIQFDKTQETLIHDVANLQTTVYWFLGAVGIFIAGLAIPAFVLSMISLMNNTKHESTTRAEDFDERARRVFREMSAELKH